MSVRKSDDFIADIQHQFEWYSVEAGGEVADRYLDAVEATCRLIGQHPHLGPQGGFAHPRLRAWRFFVVFRPFQRHILFYEVADEDVLMRRAMHGNRDLPRRLAEPPGAG